MCRNRQINHKRGKIWKGKFTYVNSAGIPGLARTSREHALTRNVGQPGGTGGRREKQGQKKRPQPGSEKEKAR